MTNRETAGEHASLTWIQVESIDERFRAIVEDTLDSGMWVLEGGPTLRRAKVADLAWRVTASTIEERDEIAGQLVTALRQFNAPGNNWMPCFADQWAPDDNEQWWGGLYFAASDIERDELERQRLEARDVANEFLGAEGSPYRLQ